MEATTTVQTGSSPIPRIFLRQDRAPSARHSSSRVDIGSPTPNANGFVQEAAEPKVGLDADWTEEIKRIWAAGAASTLELARTVFRARRSIGYGCWTRMWRSSHLPFGLSKAKMLARIGEVLGNLDGQTFGQLPSGWSILYLLSLLGAESVKRLVEEGIIHHRLTLWEARQLLANHKEQPDRSRRHQVRLRLKRFAEFFRDTVSDWEPDERELARETLTQLIEQIGAVESAVFQRDRNSSAFTTPLGPSTNPRIRL